MQNQMEYFILIFFIYSFAGWFMESMGSIVAEKKFVNRGFLIGPYCPVYGAGVVGITFLLSKYANDYILLFVLSMVLCGSLEYFTSYIMEKLFNARWWNYYNKKFNINGRICLETLIPFGIAGLLIVGIANPLTYGIYTNIENVFLFKVILYFLLTIFIVDCIVSFIIISSFKGASYFAKDNTEEISDKVKEKTEELSNLVKEKAENTIMIVESKAIVASRKLKLKELKLQRKVRYTRKKLQKEAFLPIKEIANKILIQKEKWLLFLEAKKNVIEEQIKLKQKEISDQIVQSFKNKSILSKRLIDAFPKVSIKNIKWKNEKLKK